MRRGRVTFAVDSATAVSQRARVAMIQSEIKGKRDGPILDDPEPDCALRSVSRVRTTHGTRQSGPTGHSHCIRTRRPRGAPARPGRPPGRRTRTAARSTCRVSRGRASASPSAPTARARRCGSSEGPARKASLRHTIIPRLKTIHVDSRNAPTRFTQYGPPARRRRRRARRTGRRASRRRRRADSRRGAALSCSPLYAATTRPCGRVGAFVGVAGWVSQCIHLPRGRVPCGRHRDSPRQCGSAPA